MFSFPTILLSLIRGTRDNTEDVQSQRSSSQRGPIEESVQVRMDTVTERVSDVPHTSHTAHTEAPEPTSLPRATPSPPPPPPAHYSSMQMQDDMLHEIFGGRPLDEVRASELAPPPYSKEGDYERLPSYPGHPDDEPATLARYLFIYGFFFPLFWLLGIAILCSPLETTPDWEQGKTEEEKKQLLSELRAAEVKWAKYCLWAFLSLSAIIATAVSFLFIVKLH